MRRRSPRPIRVFYSVLSERFYATRAWREVTAFNGRRMVEVTGEKFDVTADIAWVLEQHGIDLRGRLISAD